MRTRISRWGNSLALRIPASFAQDADLSDGTAVELTLQDGQLRIALVRPALNLDDLVAGITEANRHQ